MSLTTKDSDQNPGDADLQIVAAHADRLMEHFDSVQIFVSRHLQDGDTRAISRGAGNYCARIGQIKEWIIEIDQAARNNIS